MRRCAGARRMPRSHTVAARSRQRGPDSCHPASFCAVARRGESGEVFGRRSRAEFTELIAACDVLLDPFPWVAVSLPDALAAGTPIVTLPGTAMRSRSPQPHLRAGLTAKSWRRTRPTILRSRNKWPGSRSGVTAGACRWSPQRVKFTAIRQPLPNGSRQCSPQRTPPAPDRLYAARAKPWVART